MKMSCITLLGVIALTFTQQLLAEEGYFMTYSHHMEEPGNLELKYQQVFGNPRLGNAFVGSLMELEYGTKGWWTSEFYFSGQTTRNDSTVFTGWRLENRFRPLLRDHWINPVLYVEWEDLNGADKSLKEIVGHDGISDQLNPNAEARRERKREMEVKLILSSDLKGWNLSENFIAEKDITNAPWEFGYAIGISRPLRLAALPRPCVVCRENFRAGAEMYGGLGTRHEFGLHDTSHYLAPILSWALPSGVTLGVSPSFGLNSQSHGFLLRFSVSQEINQFARMFRRRG
jgi:hypothetical protein